MPKQKGVYAIVHIASDRVYIGSASNVDKRWKDHRRDLALERHRNGHLQRAWLKYGADAFEFLLIESVDDKALLLQAEQMWLDVYESYDERRGFNICRTAGSPAGYKHTDEARARISAAHTGRLKSPETRAKMAEYARNMPEEHKANLSASMRGKPKSKEHIEKMAAAHRGKPWSEEKRAKIMAGRRNRRQIVEEGD